MQKQKEKWVFKVCWQYWYCTIVPSYQKEAALSFFFPSRNINSPPLPRNATSWFPARASPLQYGDFYRRRKRISLFCESSRYE